MPQCSFLSAMSVTEKFFQAHAERLGALEAKGHLDIERFMAVCGLSWRHLVAAGLVQRKALQSTADLLAYEPTAAGRPYLLADKRLDIVVVRRGKGAQLLAGCQEA